MWSDRGTVSYMSQTGGYFVVFYYPAGRGKEKDCWLGVLFLILGIVISESLEWCENPVSLRIATELSGVIMGYV